MSRRRVLLLLKEISSFSSLPRLKNPQIKLYMEDRLRVHKDTIAYCQSILQHKELDWEPVLRSNLCQPIHHVDLVVTVGGDGTLLHASHFMDDSIPILGVNSDPTQAEELEELSDEFDATRSTGYLCAATAGNFEPVLDEILTGQRLPSELSRLSVSLNGQAFSTYALNDVLIAHPCPAAVSRFSFLLKRDGHATAPLVHCRSSGLRMCTAGGSTAAMLSAGGFQMPILSDDLQYMVREPIPSEDASSSSHLMHGVVKSNEIMLARWYSKEGAIYVDGSHVVHLIQYGDVIELSSKAPVLRVFLPPTVLRT